MRAQCFFAAMFALAASLCVDAATPWAPDRPKPGPPDESTFVDPEAARMLHAEYKGGMDAAKVESCAFQFIAVRTPGKHVFVVATPKVEFTREGHLSFKPSWVIDQRSENENRLPQKRVVWTSHMTQLEFDRPVRSFRDLKYAKLRVYRHNGHDKTDKFD